MLHGGSNIIYSMDRDYEILSHWAMTWNIALERRCYCIGLLMLSMALVTKYSQKFTQFNYLISVFLGQLWTSTLVVSNPSNMQLETLLVVAIMNHAHHPLGITTFVELCKDIWTSAFLVFVGGMEHPGEWEVWCCIAVWNSSQGWIRVGHIQ